jgi:hypothetical protein
MKHGFLVLTATAAALMFGGVLLLTAPSAGERPSAAPVALSGSEHEASAERAASPDTWYSGCNAVRAAGAAPLYRDQPGYRPEMDGDGDGIACEPYRNAAGERSAPRIRVPRRIYF